MSTRDALIALRRFGLGARPGEAKAIAADPRGFVLSQLDNPQAALIGDDTLAPSHVIFTQVREAQRAQKAMRDAAREAGAGTPAATPGMTEAGKSMSGAASPMPGIPPVPAEAAQPMAGAVKPGKLKREALHDDREARVAKARATDAPLVERLVQFWSNHFTVSILKGQVRGIAGAYEREAIRPNVLGRFGALVKAVEQHPAMLLYLDNAASTGPNSKAGNRRAKGLNENLAREILELHTVGVDAGYTQDDVTALARIITGWGVAALEARDAEPGTFHFAANRHEPGPSTVMGRAYGGDGLAKGESCLADLARHPATARHVAGKLAAHFVGAGAPAALTAALEKAFRDSEGDLAQVLRVLVASPLAWEAKPVKVVAPYDWVISLARAFELKTQPGELIRLSGTLGHPVWEAPSPKGWPDGDDTWLSASPLRERLRIAGRLVRDIPDGVDPRGAAEGLFADTLSAETKQAVARADNRQQGFEILMMSPEFLRR